jgi:hypothetical protein
VHIAWIFPTRPGTTRLDSLRASSLGFQVYYYLLISFISNNSSMAGTMKSLLAAAALLSASSLAAPTLHGRQYSNSTCLKTTVAIM